MTLQASFILLQILIVVPFAAGWALRRRFARPEEFTRKLILYNLISVEPALVLWSTWGLAPARDLAVLPLAGLLLAAAGWLLGVPIGTALGLSGRRRTAFHITSSLANHGFTMGGFVCFMLLGEKGLGLSFIFTAYFMPFIFLVVFPYANSARRGGTGFARLAREFIRNPRNMPLYAILVSVLFHTLGVPRPDFAFPLEALIAVSMSVYYFTLGMSFYPGEVRGAMRENACVALLKFVVVPALAALVLGMLPLDPAVRAVIQIQAFMPAAVYSVITAVLYDLDAPFASGVFVVNTLLFLAVVLPLIFLLRSAFVPA
ncbi:MAG TPA: AEC family transporter [Spirochaetota bacterium]|nr:AEC family transporter [Spirochaetota bacterium]